MKSYYTLLDIPENADLTEIKTAYRRLASRYHPDVNSSPEAAEIFKLINRAYNVLVDPDKRRDYNNLLSSNTIFKKSEDEVVESSSFWPSLSNTFATTLTLAFLALITTAFVEWIAEIKPIFWNFNTILSLILGIIFGGSIGFNSNFNAQAIFNKKIALYRLIFWSFIIITLGWLFYINYLLIIKVI